MKLNIFLKRNSFVFGLALICFLLGFNDTIKAEKVSLAKNGVSLHSVVIGSEASDRTRDAANDLAEYLGYITGGNFVVKVGDGTGGLAVGTYKDFPQLKFSNLFDSEDIMRKDEYLLRTHNKGIYLIGATDFASQFAVWGFLNQIGYRQFFPTKTWEFIPKNSNLNVEINVFEHPSFYQRTAPHYAPFSDRELWTRWEIRNRTHISYERVGVGSYANIISRNQEVFDKHPEYLALVDGVRGGGREKKLCISNKDLRKLVVEYMKSLVEAKPHAPIVMLYPSDGGDWCECDECAKIGSISDQAVTLANDVAEAVNKMNYGDKYVTFSAYNMHSIPPNIDVNPKVYVTIATEFIKGGYTVDELIKGWSKRTKILGIREYHDVFSWDLGLPHRSRGGNIKYLLKNIPYFYNAGARFINSEAADTWGVNGLGYYLSSIILWDVDAVNRAEEIIEDFLEKSFEEAKDPMRKFFFMINQDYDTPRSNEDLLANMYGYINEARKLTKNNMVHARLDDLALYTRYVELMMSFRSLDKGDSTRDKVAQDLFRHVYRMQNTMLIPTYALYTRLQRMGIGMPEEANPGRRPSVGEKLEDVAPWKSSKLFTNQEIAQFIENGVATYNKDKMEFKPIRFSEDLVPAAESLNLPKVTTGDFGSKNLFRGTQRMFTWFNPDNKQVNLKVTAGLRSNTRGNVKFELLSPQEVYGRAVDINESVEPNKKTHSITLKSPFEGIHEIEWFDGKDLTTVEWPEGFPMTVRSSIDDPATLRNRRTLYFYVPKGTKIVGGFTSGNNNGNTKVHDADGNQVFDMSDVEGGNGYFSIPVAKGQDGKLWSFYRAFGTQVLMTVPPYLARNERELLLPKEVVEADKSK